MELEDYSELSSLALNLKTEMKNICCLLYNKEIKDFAVN